MPTLDSQVHAYERNHPGRPWIGTLYGPPEVTYTLDRNSQAPRLDFDAERLKAIAAGCAEAIDDADFTLGRPVGGTAR